MYDDSGESDSEGSPVGVASATLRRELLQEENAVVRPDEDRGGVDLTTTSASSSQGLLMLETSTCLKEENAAVVQNEDRGRWDQSTTSATASRGLLMLRGTSTRFQEIPAPPTRRPPSATLREEATSAAGPAGARGGAGRRLSSTMRPSSASSSSLCLNGTRQSFAATAPARPQSRNSRSSGGRGRSNSKGATQAPSRTSCSRGATCNCDRCIAASLLLGRKPPQRQPPAAHWPLLPDVVLMQVVALLGLKELSSAVAVCSSWAETITSSEAWIWSAVGAAGLPGDVFSLLENWAKKAQSPLRQALQLWPCRAHLWGASFGDNVHHLQADMPCSTVPTCCGVCAPAPGEEGPCSVGIAFASGVIAFCRLHLESDGCRSLRGQKPSSLEVVSSVRAAHGTSIVTACQPFPSMENRALTAGLDGLLRYWDTSTAQEVSQVITEHLRGINDLALNPWDQTLLTCGDQGLVLLHEAEPTFTTLARCPLQAAAVYCARWTGPSAFVTGGFDRRALLWDSRALSQPALVLPARQHVYAVAALSGRGASPGNLAIGMADGAIAQWDLRGTSKEPLRELRGHSAAVEALAVLPGDVLTSASADGVLRFWDAGKSGESTWMWTSPGHGALTSLSPLMEDSIMVTGLGLRPSVLSLDYAEAIPASSVILEQLQTPILRPWKRGEGPPEGVGRHSALLRQQRLQRGSTRSLSMTHPSTPTAPRGAFDRCLKLKALPLGATGAAHRAFLCGLRH